MVEKAGIIKTAEIIRLFGPLCAFDVTANLRGGRFSRLSRLKHGLQLTHNVGVGLLGRAGEKTEVEQTLVGDRLGR